LGPDLDVLAKIQEEFQKKMTESKMMTDIETSYRAGLPELQILPNRDEAALRGVSVSDINRTIQAMIGGVKVARYTKDGYRYDVRLRLDKVNRSNKEDVLKLEVRNNRGEIVPLANVVTLDEQKILQEINRENRQRTVTLTANIAEGSSQDKAIRFIREESKTLPNGYRLKFSGSSEAFQETFKGLILAIILGIVVAYMLLGSQFNSFFQPVIVLLAIPFSLSGAFFALLLFQQSLNIYSMIGILLVMGLVMKNSIMLVDFTNKKIEEGLSIRKALEVACPLRLRPILMTSIATIAGAVPAALSLGPGAESMKPLAWTVIGGMLISTLFTLFVVPAFYLMFVKERSVK
jgi:HAE1 family hydrophobic/amphiphilic exporter-1